MSTVSVTKSKLHQNWQQRLEGEDLDRTLIRYKDTDYFWREDKNLDPETPIYEVVLKAGEPVEGHLNWGYICLYPGRVDDQYFCTRGHFNSNENAEEYLLCMQGDGLIMYMNEDGHVWCEQIEEGSLHHVKQGLAYRLINLGDEELLFSLCTPSNTTADTDHLKDRPFACHVYEDQGDMAIYVENPLSSGEDEPPFIFEQLEEVQPEAAKQETPAAPETKKDEEKPESKKD